MWVWWSILRWPSWTGCMSGLQAGSGGRSRGPASGSMCPECFQQAKNEAGLDHYQVRTWRAWYAHITLSMLALAWLAASRAQALKGEPQPPARA
jgi:hypothetical protein